LLSGFLFVLIVHTVTINLINIWKSIYNKCP